MPDEVRKPEDLSFEEAMGALENIVGSLETGNLPLEEMVAAYERGVKMLGACRARIATARQRVELITADLEGRGRATLSEFAPQDAGDAAAPESAAKKPKRKPAAPAEETEDPGDGGIRLF